MATSAPKSYYIDHRLPCSHLSAGSLAAAAARWGAVGRYSIDVELRLDVEIVENSLISFHMIMSQYVNVMFSHHVNGCSR